MWFMLVSKAAIFEFLVNQESSKFFSVIIGFLIHENMGIDTKIVSLSILETEL